jgi:hypothetical protein
MSTDPSQLPPAGVIPPPPEPAAAPAQPPIETTPVETQTEPSQELQEVASVLPDAPAAPVVKSPEKVRTGIEQLLELKGAAFAAFAGPLIGELRLPEAAEDLDRLLEEAARLLISLRSDDASPISLGAVSA